MATYLENLQTARDNIAANLAAMTANPKPNYSIDGQSVSWGDLFNSYNNQLKIVDASITAIEPFEYSSYGF